MPTNTIDRVRKHKTRNGFLRIQNDTSADDMRIDIPLSILHPKDKRFLCVTTGKIITGGITCAYNPCAICI